MNLNPSSVPRTMTTREEWWPVAFYYGCVLGMNTPCFMLCSNVYECVMFTLFAGQTLKTMWCIFEPLLLKWRVSLHSLTRCYCGPTSRIDSSTRSMWGCMSRACWTMLPPCSSQNILLKEWHGRTTFRPGALLWRWQFKQWHTSQSGYQFWGTFGLMGE